MMVGDNFEETYPVKKSYRRFHQMHTAQHRAKRAGKPSYNDEARKDERMKKEMPGFTLVDNAFKDAASTLSKASHSGSGNQNSGFYSWSSLGVTRKPEGVPRWEGSPKEASRIVAKAGKYYGAVGVGFTGLDSRWVYSHDSDGRPIVFEDIEEGYVSEEKAVIPESHKWVIAITVPMEVEEMMYAQINPVVNMAYSRMPFVIGSLAEFIRGLGYHAIPCGNDTALSVPIATQAGLGHVGRLNRLITWERGPMVRIAKIFTDLPLEPSSLAPKGIIEFCEVCKKCAQLCPSKSITEGPRTYEGFSEANNPGVFTWYSNGDTCYDYWRKLGYGCSICLKVCNFTKPEGRIHDVVKWFIRNVPQLNRFWVWTDGVMGYGKMREPSGYWEKKG